ncbi:MAG: hypothetical protein WD941_02665 [Opitutus sp.]
MCPLRSCLCLLMAAAGGVTAAVPPELDGALRDFRPDPPPGWSYTQTTVAGGKSIVERHNAAKPAFDRWSLVRQDGREPTPDELRHYMERRSRWSRTGTAPRITEQFDPGTIELVTESSDRAVYRARLRPGEMTDRTARFLRVAITLHKPTRTIETLELASVGAFSPTFGVRISTMQTIMTYMPPSGDMPTLPGSVATRVRGRAYLVKSLDADMTVTYSDYERAMKPR